MTNLIRRPLAFGLCLVLVAALGCGGGGRKPFEGGPNSSDPDVGVRLIVTRSLPTNGQEVLANLADAGEEQDAGKVTIEFSERLDPTTILDANNAFNGFTSDFNFLNSAFQRVPGTPQITGANGNIVEFTPANGTLANGQYTITVTRDVQSFDGGRMNLGLRDFHSSFTVGADTYSPVVRNTYPAPNQKEVPKTAEIIVTFNESLNPATVNAGAVTVVYGAASTPVAGTVSLSQDGFDVLFTPDPANPMPANVTVVVTVTGGPNGVTDRVGNPYEGEPTTAPRLIFQFETVKEPPLPNAPFTIDITTFTNAAVYFGTDSGTVGIINEAPFIANSVDLTTWGTNNPVLNSPTTLKVDGQTGRPGEIVVDPRFNAATGHSWFYVVDDTHRVVHVMASQTCRLVHTWRELSDPRGLAIDPRGRTLYVTNGISDSVSALDIGSISPVGTLGASQALKDVTKYRADRDYPVGRGPYGAAHKPDGYVLFVANALENSCTVIATNTMQTVTTFPIGYYPQDAAATVTFPGIGFFAFITCLGGGGDTAGSVALYWNVPNGLQANITGFLNPKGIIYDQGAAAWITNSGGESVTQLTLAIAGGGFAATILPQITATVETGKNPVDVTVEPFYTFFTTVPRAVLTADRGSSRITILDPRQPARPRYTMQVTGISTIAGYMDQ